jgi:DNA-binding NarL/FixJ family response regulator
MGKIAVFLAIRPRMLSEVVRHIVERQPDMEVVSEVADSVELLLALKATEAEVVLITSAALDRKPGMCNYLLAAYPHLKIIDLLSKSDTAFLYEVGSLKKRIDEVGEESILSAIRAFMR